MGVRGFVTHSTEQGPREYQEDRFFYGKIPCTNPTGWLIAVMDGHGGNNAALICATQISQLFPEDSLPDDIEEHLMGVVDTLDGKTRHFESGTTLSIACVLEERDEVVIAILGDSHVIVIDEADKVHISPEHNVRTNFKERVKAIERGARYDTRGYIQFRRHYIQMSRALGDAPLDKILDREPEIYTIKRPRWVLVGTDGILDPSHYNTHSLANNLAKLADTGVTASGIMEWAKSQGLQDNATALLWKPGHV